MHRIAGICGLTAGVYVLAGPGWALLVFGALAWLAGDVKWAEIRDVAHARAKAAATYVRSAPRRVLAATSMGAGVAGVPAGVLVWVGVGPAVLAAGALLLGLGVLLGWNA